MGQATLDLPDPGLSGLNAGPMSAEALASADDLLSQLAGDDIDRLLAEAEAERPSTPLPTPTASSAVEPAEPPSPAPAPESSPPVTPAVADAAEASTAAAIDAILAPAIESTLKAVESQLDELPTESPPLPPQVIDIGQASAAASAEKKVLDDAAAHVAAIMDPAPAAIEPASPQNAPIQSVPIQPVSLQPVPFQPASSPSTTLAVTAVADAAERQALSEPLIIPVSGKTSANRLSLLITLLEWINSPMLLLPDALREAIGKIAIMTTFNAIAVIIYVTVFRRPHH